MDNPILREELIQQARDRATSLGYTFANDAERTLRLMIENAADIPSFRQQEAIDNLRTILETAMPRQLRNESGTLSGKQLSAALVILCPIWPFC